MMIVNLTPHDINIMGCGVIQSSGLARVSVTKKTVGSINGIPVNTSSFGDVTGLPNPSKDVIYVVSLIVAQAVKGQREDCFVVDDTIRDDSGRIVGCKALARV